MIKKSRHLKWLLLTLSFSLLAFGFDPLANSAKATTEGASTLSGEEIKNQCSEILKVSKSNQDSLATLERLVSYLESSVTDINMTVNRIDRKLNTAN